MIETIAQRRLRVRPLLFHAWCLEDERQRVEWCIAHGEITAVDEFRNSLASRKAELVAKATELGIPLAWLDEQVHRYNFLNWVNSKTDEAISLWTKAHPQEVADYPQAMV